MKTIAHRMQNAEQTYVRRACASPIGGRKHLSTEGSVLKAVTGKRCSVIFESRGWKGGVMALTKFKINARTSKHNLRHEHLALRSESDCDRLAKATVFQRQCARLVSVRRLL